MGKVFAKDPPHPRGVSRILWCDQNIRNLIKNLIFSRLRRAFGYPFHTKPYFLMFIESLLFFKICFLYLPYSLPEKYNLNTSDEGCIIITCIVSWIIVQNGFLNQRATSGNFPQIIPSKNVFSLQKLCFSKHFDCKISKMFYFWPTPPLYASCTLQGGKLDGELIVFSWSYSS